MLQVVSFRLHDQVLLLDVAQVQEILAGRPIAPVPLAPDFAAGLVNLRGRIVMAVYLDNLLTGAPPRPHFEPMHLIVHAEGEAVSLLVDEVGDVLSVPQEAVAPLPPNLRGLRKAFLRGVCEIEQGLAPLLDAGRIVEFSTSAPDFNERSETMNL